MKVLLLSLFSVLSISYFGGTVALAAGANEDIKAICSQNPTSELCKGYTSGSNTVDDNANPVINVIKAIINILLYAAGVLSVIFVMFGGFKYITSAGDPQKAASGRQTLLYALVGLVVVAIAVPLVSFAFSKLT
jgi:hypothetical protein